MPNAIFTALKGLAHVGDTAVVSAAGAAIGGARGAMGYDSDQERDPLLAQTPVVGRFKAAAVGALKGAAVGAAGAVGLKTMQFGARALMEEGTKQFANTDTLTGSFIRGFKGMNAPGDIPIGQTAARGKQTAAEGGYYSFSKVHGKTLDQVEEVIQQGEKSAVPAKASHRTGARASYETASGPGRSERLHTTPTATPTAGPSVSRDFAPWLDDFGGKPKGPSKMNVGQTAPKGGTKKVDLHESRAGRLNEEARASYGGNNAQRARQKSLYQASEEIGLDVNTGAANARGMTIDKVRQFRKLDEMQQGLVGMTELPGIVASAIGGLAGTVTHAARAGVGAYKKHIIDPAKEGKAVSAGLFHIKNPNYPSTIPGVKEKIGRDVTAPFVAGVGILGAAAFGIGGAVGASSYGAPAGHPMNAIFKTGDAAVSARAQMEADSAQKIKMQRPTMLGLNDTDEAYFTNPALKPRREARHTPGKYNDDGSLVFALSNLRRSV